MTEWDQSKLDIVSDITSIPEPDASFDAVMCVEVFEHLPEKDLDIMELTANGNFFAYLLQEVSRIPDIARKYAGGGLTKIDRLGIRLVQSLLFRMLSKDTGTQEFVCFGYHVLARKRECA